MTKKIRIVRSYVLRESRLTNGQQKAIDDYMHIWGSLPNETYCFEEIYQNQNDTVLEIGFGMGKSLIEQAIQMPHVNFLGIEIHKPGVGACLADIAHNKLSNVRVLREDIKNILKNIPQKSLRKIQIFFPDPWHKKRHHKRRLVQIPFVEKLSDKLCENGELHLATDWKNYAEHMILVLNQISDLKNISITDDYIERPETRPITKFEVRGKKLGHGVWDIVYKKCIEKIA